jgi:RNA recognition motif-containing protein
MTKLFIANLPFHVTEGQTKQLFELFGIVRSVKLMTDMQSGKSKGYGFLEMSNDDEAQRAINAFNGQEIDGRRIAVQPSKQKASHLPQKRPRKLAHKIWL